jgi:hypothetical protein
MVSRKTCSLATLLCFFLKQKSKTRTHKTKVDTNHTTTKQKADLYPVRGEGGTLRDPARCRNHSPFLSRGRGRRRRGQLLVVAQTSSPDCSSRCGLVWRERLNYCFCFEYFLIKNIFCKKNIYCLKHIRCKCNCVQEKSDFLDKAIRF